MRAKITVGIFIALLFGLAVLNLASPSQAFSENENRVLQRMPAFSVDALLSGKFTADFDKFITDQFVFRDSWVGVKTLSEQALLKHSSNGVYFADDQYLIEMFDTVDHEQYEKNLNILAEFSRRVQAQGVSAYTMLVPTSSMILADKLPANAPEIDQRALLNQASELIPGFVDVSAALQQHNGEYIYYRTDHHWTSLGAFYAYARWQEVIGLPGISPENYQQAILSEEFLGTTYSKANLYTIPPDTITAFTPSGLGPVSVDYNNGETVTDSIYEMSFLEKKDKYSVFFNANQPITRVTTGKQNGKKLLLIKDSYANTFAQMVLNDYEEIVMIDLRYFKTSVYDFVLENQITDLLILYNVKGFSQVTDLYYLTTGEAPAA